MAQPAKKVVLDTDKHAVSSSKAKKGAFNRGSSTFLNHISSKVDKITTDENGTKTFPAAKNRYHLYVSPACPWCHRCWTTIVLKGLTDVISVSFVHPYLEKLGGPRGKGGYRGWAFTPGVKKEENDKYLEYLRAVGRDSDQFDYSDPIKHTRDPNVQISHAADLYEYCDKDYNKGYTVPILWDTVTDTIVNNESSIIIEMLNSEFNEFSSFKDSNSVPELAPKELTESMTKVNDFIYPQINNGVYASGFARSQEAYNEAVTKVFDGLDKCEAILKKSKWIAGNNDGITLSDVRLWVTLIRFDRIYYDHFKCNLARICDEYPALNEYIYRIYNIPGVKNTVDLPHFKYHYCYSHTGVNGFGIVPLGPELPFASQNGNETEQKSDQ